MPKLIRRTVIGICAAVLAVLAGLGAPSVQAAVDDDAAGSPATFNVQLTRSTSVTIKWTATIRATVGAELFSTEGEFLAGGQVIGTISQRISTSLAGLALPGVATITERLAVPRNVMLRARQLGAASVTYSRIFSDTVGPTRTATVTLAATGAASAGFNIIRLSLRFGSDARVEITGQGEDLQARAEIRFSGRGTLAGEWQAAGPASTAGVTIFRTLRIVRRNLTGNQRIMLYSPRLPTETTGLHFVRFVVSDPEIDGTTPVIRYFVQPSGPEVEAAVVTPIGLQRPGRSAALTTDTIFAWSGIGEARAYRLELHDGGEARLSKNPVAPSTEGTALPERTVSDRPGLAGVFIPGHLTETALEALTRSHLEPGRSYCWRITAFRADGRVIGRSACRKIHLPRRSG